MRVKVTITRYVSDDPQPGIIECQLVDANRRVWTFIEKKAIPWCANDLEAHSTYPLPGAIECVKIAERRDASGRAIIRIDTDKPWGVESVDGVSQFDVFPESIELEEDVQRA